VAIVEGDGSILDGKIITSSIGAPYIKAGVVPEGNVADTRIAVYAIRHSACPGAIPVEPDPGCITYNLVKKRVSIDGAESSGSHQKSGLLCG